jgi:hypothetical protein
VLAEGIGDFRLPIADFQGPRRKPKPNRNELEIGNHPEQPNTIAPLLSAIAGKKELTMLRFPGIQRSRRRKGLATASTLLLLFSTAGLAQSGRKNTKPPQPIAPVPKDEPLAPVIGARDLNHKVTLLVARQPTSKHLLSEDAIFGDLVTHLNEIRNVSATSIGDMKRDEIVKRAKKEKDDILVLMSFDIDTFQKGTIFLNSPDLNVKVQVFAPVTGQEKFKGKVYYKAQSGPNVKKDNWPTGTPIKITTEAVAVEAAEQVRDWLVLQDRNKKDN